MIHVPQTVAYQPHEVQALGEHGITEVAILWGPARMFCRVFPVWCEASSAALPVQSSTIQIDYSPAPAFATCDDEEGD